MADIVYDIHIYRVILANIGARYSRYNLRLQLSNTFLETTESQKMLPIALQLWLENRKETESLSSYLKKIH